MIVKTYTILHDYAFSSRRGEGWMPTEKTLVFVFVTDPYRETNKLRPYHKRRRVWSKCDSTGSKPICGKHRTRQVERWCHLVRAQCEVETVRVDACG